MNAKIFTAMAAGLLVVAVGGAGAGKDEGTVKEILQVNRGLNEAFTKRDAEAIRRLTTDDHVAITPYYGGPQMKAEQLKNLADLQVPDYETGDVKVNLLTGDAALVTYSLKQKGTYKGTPVAARNYVAAVWVNKGGKWLEASYQETPLPERK